MSRLRYEWKENVDYRALLSTVRPYKAAGAGQLNENEIHVALLPDATAEDVQRARSVCEAAPYSLVFIAEDPGVFAETPPEVVHNQFNMVVFSGAEREISTDRDFVKVIRFPFDPSRHSIPGTHLRIRLEVIARLLTDGSAQLRLVDVNENSEVPGSLITINDTAAKLYASEVDSADLTSQAAIYELQGKGESANLMVEYVNLAIQVVR